MILSASLIWISHLANEVTWDWKVAWATRLHQWLGLLAVCTIRSEEAGSLQLALTGLKSGGRTNIQAVSFTQDQPLPWSTVKIYPGFAEMEKPRSTVEAGGSYVRPSPPCPWQTSTLLLLPLRPPQKGQRNESLRNTLQCPINEHFLDLNVNSHPQLWNAPPLTIPLTKDWFELL